MNTMSNVYIIFAKPFTLGQVTQELIEEGYNHNFFFGNGRSYEEKINALKISNEVWVFGDCTGYEDYEIAKLNNADIWKMG